MVPLGEGAAAPPGLSLHLADLFAGLELGAPPPLGRRAAVHAPVPALILRHEVVAVARATTVLGEQSVGSVASSLGCIFGGRSSKQKSSEHGIN